MPRFLLWLSVVILVSACSDSTNSTNLNTHKKQVSELSTLTLTPTFSSENISWQQTGGPDIALNAVGNQLTLDFPATPVHQTYQFKVSASGDQSELYEITVSPYITGYVTDDPIAGATVRLMSLDGDTEYAQTTTDASGLFRFNDHHNLSHYRILIDAQSGTTNNGKLFMAEMQSQCIHIEERHQCHVTPISTLTSQLLDEQTEIITKAEVMTRLSAALNIDLTKDPFVHEDQVYESGYTVNLTGIREYIGNGRNLNNWVDTVRSYIKSKDDSLAPRVIQGNNYNIEQINNWFVPPHRDIHIGNDVIKTFGDPPFIQTASGGNGGSISYQSSLPDVATVNTTGRVTILKPGTTVITATEAESPHYLPQHDSYTLTVAKATGRALQAGGDISKLIDSPAYFQTASGGNGGQITYSSSDTNVATVDNNGLVTITGTGITQITATEAESDYYQSQSDSYIMNVNNHAVVDVKFNSHAFAALRQNGSVVAWGLSDYGGDTSTVHSLINGSVPVIQLSGNSSAFAALRNDGSVVTWGDLNSGGGNRLFSNELNGDNTVVRVYSNENAFAALREDGSVITWGDSQYGADKGHAAGLLDGRVPATHIYEHKYGFAATRQSSSLVVWGKSFHLDYDTIHNLSAFDNPVVNMFNNKEAFAALRKDGTVVTFGIVANSKFGGDSSSVASELNDKTNPVLEIHSTNYSFSALRKDGSVVTWGSIDDAGSQISGTSELNGSPTVSRVFSMPKGYIALRSDNSIVTWGGLSDTNQVSSELSDPGNPIVSATGNEQGEAVLRSDGSVVTWGPHRDASIKPVIDGDSKIVDLHSTKSFFIALREDGTLVIWGNKGEIPYKSSAPLNPVIAVHTQQESDTFAAIHKDGRLTVFQIDYDNLQRTFHLKNAVSDNVKAEVIGGYVNNSPTLDTDGDGITNVNELENCTTPYPNVGQPPCLSAGNIDSDGDGLSDKFELDNQLNPLKFSQQEQNGDANLDGKPDHWMLP